MKKRLILSLVIISILILAPSNSSKAENSLAYRLKGRILIQVESHGEAWYINPSTLQRQYMADGQAAYGVMRNSGIGITNADLNKFQNNKNLAKKQNGKIFLQVQDKGQAYYVNSDGTLYYLKDGAAAYSVMRNLGLGITDKDLSKITVFSIPNSSNSNTAPLVSPTPITVSTVDSDNDGLIDVEERIAGTNPNVIDTDNDGLSDYEEIKIYMTNPLVADTDGDGFLDGAEVKAGKNPNGPGSLMGHSDSDALIDAKAVADAKASVDAKAAADAKAVADAKAIEDARATAKSEVYLNVNQAYLSESGVEVTVNSITKTEETGSYKYTISYIEKNKTTDKELSPGTFKIFFEDGTGLNQYGFFNNLFPGGISSGSYTFEFLKTKKPSVIEYNNETDAGLDGAFFREVPASRTLKWKVE